jgi:hypothetical protein
MAEKHFLTTPKQINSFDWYYNVGNDYLSVKIELNKKDEQSVKEAFRRLIRDREILRSCFVRSGDVIYRKELDWNDDIFEVQFCSTKSYNEYKAFDQLALDELINENINNNRLCKAIVYDSGNYWVLVIYVHHIICNASSLNIIKNDFIELYQNEQVLISSYKFGEYADYIILKCCRNYGEELLYHQRSLTAIDNKLFEFQAKRIYTDTSSSFINSLTDKTLNDKYTTPSDIKTNLFLFASIFEIDDYKYLQNELAKNGLSLFSVIVAAYAKAMAKIVCSDFYVQFFMDYRNSKYSINQIGDFTADFYLPLFYEKIKANDGLNFLKDIKETLFKIYKHPVFNYQLFNINAERLFHYGNALINYVEGGKDIYNIPASELDTFTKVKDHLICRTMSFSIELFNNGKLFYRLTFNDLVYSQKQITEFNSLWVKYFSDFISIIDNKEDKTKTK